MDRPFIILDISGVLIDKFFYKDSIEKNNDSDLSVKRRMKTIGKTIIVVRDDLSPFLEKLFLHYNVGIYSSMPKGKVATILKEIMSVEQRKHLVCIFDRNDTIPDPDDTNISTLKSVDHVCIVCGIKINNIVIVDDNERKLRFIQQQNKIIVPPNSISRNNHFDNLFNLISEHQYT